jgi:glycosyltransferase involved in cell wall biosynthesis
MRRPRLLNVVPRTPWPLDDGGRIGLWQFVSSTARAFDSTLAILAAAGEHPDLGPFRAIGVDPVIVRHRTPPTAEAALRGVFGRWPYTLARYWSRDAFDRLTALAVEREPDLVLLHHLHLAPYAEAFPNSAVVLREHNVEFVWMRRLAERAANPLVAAYARHQARRLRIVEAERCARCDLVLAVQDIEAGLLRDLQSDAPVETVPVGVDLSRFDPPRREHPPVVLLPAAWNWGPNAAGAVRFLEEGWPILHARHPGARLRLVGKGLGDTLARRAREAGAEPMGYVASMRDAFATASVMAVPLWVGAGARVKIVEALAARLPVVSTPLGAEGLGVEDGTTALIRETPQALAEAIAALLDEPERLERMAAAGRVVAEDRYALDAVARRTVALLESALERRSITRRTPC